MSVWVDSSENHWYEGSHPFTTSNNQGKRMPHQLINTCLHMVHVGALEDCYVLYGDNLGSNIKFFQKDRRFIGRNCKEKNNRKISDTRQSNLWWIIEIWQSYHLIDQIIDEEGRLDPLFMLYTSTFCLNKEMFVNLKK